jgi:hypothetical protein
MNSMVALTSCFVVVGDTAARHHEIGGRRAEVGIGAPGIALDDLQRMNDHLCIK